MLFYLFCMFHYYWRIIHRSQKSDGKGIVWTPYFWRSAVRGKYAEGLIFPDDGASQKGRPRRAAMGPPHRPARPPLPPRRHMVRGPTTPSAIALSRTTSPRNPKVGENIEDSHRRLLEAENTREKRALRQAEICRGNSLPEGGNRRHRHRHRAGLHWDHHHHHLHHWHRHLHRCTSSPL